MWERGLKLSVSYSFPYHHAKSLPMWERGLKLRTNRATSYRTVVAPHVGAWIETTLYAWRSARRTSLPMWEHGLKLFLVDYVET